MKTNLSLVAVVLALLGTGCASGPAMVSLGSYLDEVLQPSKPEAVAEKGPPPGEVAEPTVSEQAVVEEPMGERVVRERVIREEVIIEQPTTVEIVHPRRVYVSGVWYNPSDVVIAHVHGPGCGHYFYGGVWYNNPDIIIVDAYTPACAYVCYDGLWYPRHDIFITPYVHYRRRPSFGAMVIWGAWPWHWGRHRDIDIDIDVHHHYDGGGRNGPPAPPDRGGRVPKAESGLPEGRAQKAPLVDRRARPVLVNDDIGSQAASDLARGSSGVPVSQAGLAQKPGRGSGQSETSLPASTLPSTGSQVRTTKAPRSADTVKASRSGAGVSAERVSPRAVQTTGQKASRDNSTLSTAPEATARPEARGIGGGTTSRTSARDTSSARTGIRSPQTTPEKTYTPSVASPDTKATRPVRRPGVIDVGPSSGSSRTNSTSVVPRSPYPGDTTRRESRPVLGSQRQTTTTTVEPRQSYSPSRSTSVEPPQTTVPRSLSSPRSSFTTKPSRTFSAPSSSSPPARTAPQAPSYTSRSTFSSGMGNVRSSRPSTSSFSAPSRSSAASGYRSSPSFSGSRSYSPSVSSRSSAAPSRSVSPSSARSSGAQAARSAR